MLIDKITIKGEAGKGGDGVVKWRREKFVPLGGPWGGNGGKGGDLYFRAIRDVYGLQKYDNNKEYFAKDGESGGTKLKSGLAGDDVILDIPVGSIVYNREYDLTYKFDVEGETRLMLRGGKGGYGNDHFKSSTNRSPEEFTKGARGEYATFDIEVEMIAKVGLIGLPNAGKSTLLNEITRANAKTANYAFTTLEPNLGNFRGYVLADLPGLIEGAADGKGLGHKFLKHIKRTEVLMHMVSAENDSVSEVYKTVRLELGKYDSELIEKEEILILSKTDTVTTDELIIKLRELEKESGKKVLQLSVYSDKDISNLSSYLQDFLDNS